MPKKKANLTLHFAWHTASVDPRQFNQQRQLVHPITGMDEDTLAEAMKVAIEIPNTDEYIFSHKRATEDTPEIITLTPTGQFFAISLLEAPYTKEKETSTDDNEWGEDTTEETSGDVGEEEDSKESEVSDDEWPDESSDDETSEEDNEKESEDDDKEWDIESEDWDG